MHFVLLSVLCSVTVSVIIKLARRYSVNILQMIAWNYPAAILASMYYLSPSFQGVSFSQAPVGIYVGLGLLLPLLFVIMAGSIRYTGMVRTEVAQRLSLFIPVMAAFLIFNETLVWSKLLGIGVGFAAILCSIKWQHAEKHVKSQNNWLYPLSVFIGMGVIDILFKQAALYQAVPYTTSILIVFILCAIVSFLYIFYLALSGKTTFSLSGTLWGLALGLFNFGNILFYMKAHQILPENPSMVFSAMNIGVIVVGALVGLFVFREKLSNLNKLGLLLAVVAVLMIAFL